KLAIVLVACVALLVSGCGSGPQDLIVGKWEAGEAGTKVTARVAKNGTAKTTILGKKLQGTPKGNGEDEFERTLNGKTTKAKFKVTATELEVSNDGQTVKYKKV